MPSRSRLCHGQRPEVHHDALRGQPPVAVEAVEGDERQLDIAVGRRKALKLSDVAAAQPPLEYIAPPRAAAAFFGARIGGTMESPAVDWAGILRLTKRSGGVEILAAARRLGGPGDASTTHPTEIGVV